MPQLLGASHRHVGRLLRRTCLAEVAFLFSVQAFELRHFLARQEILAGLLVRLSEEKVRLRICRFLPRRDLEFLNCACRVSRCQQRFTQDSVGYRDRRVCLYRAAGIRDSLLRGFLLERELGQF